MVWHVLQSGFSAKEQPMKPEVLFASAQAPAMPEAQKQMRNPVPATDEVLAGAGSLCGPLCELPRERWKWLYLDRTELLSKNTRPD